jgi:DNA-binding FrmR family transcriptional regulator
MVFEVSFRLNKLQQKLAARIERIRGQVDPIERSLSGGDDCADVRMPPANVRGGINSLMAGGARRSHPVASAVAG